MSTAANAIGVFLVPETQDVSLGDQVAVDLYWDFTGDAALGGGTDFAWDPAALSLVSIVFDSNPDFDPALTRPPCHEGDDICIGAGYIDGLATGNFDGLAGDGPLLIATITFDTLAAGSFAIDIAEDVGGIGGVFVSAGRLNPYPGLQFTGATVNVNAVPLPAAIWLMIGGLGTMLGYRRKA